MNHLATLVGAGSGVLLLAGVSSCVEPARQPPALGRLAPAAATSTTPSLPPPTQPGRRVTLSFPGSAKDARISPDDRWLARVVRQGKLGRAILLDDLTQPDGPSRLLLTSESTELVAFTSPSRLLSFDPPAREAASWALDGRDHARASCRHVPVASPDASGLATIDGNGQLVWLDSTSLAVRWRLAAPTVPSDAGELAVAFVARGLVAVTWGGGAFVVEPSTQRVLFQQWVKAGQRWAKAEAALAGLVVSPTGRFIESETLGADPRWTSSIVDTQSGAMVFTNERASIYDVPAFAFSRDESSAAYSFGPSEVTLVSLPKGKARTVQTGIQLTEGYSYLTDELAFSADGGLVCGHPVTSIGKYSDCTSLVYADARRARRVGAVQTCSIEGDVAVVTPRLVGVEREGRKRLMTLSATYTHVCNSVLDPSHKLFGVVTAKWDPVTAGLYQDAEMNLVDASSGAVVRRLALGSGPAGMGELLYSSFSPSGRWLQVRFGDRLATFDATTGVPVATLADVDELFAFSSSEKLGLVTTHGALLVLTMADGSVRRFPDAIGERCLLGELLAPASRCPPAP